MYTHKMEGNQKCRFELKDTKMLQDPEVRIDNRVLHIYYLVTRTMRVRPPRCELIWEILIRSNNLFMYFNGFHR
jgi:hypothetical protein